MGMFEDEDEDDWGAAGKETEKEPRRMVPHPAAVDACPGLGGHSGRPGCAMKAYDLGICSW